MTTVANKGCCTPANDNGGGATEGVSFQRRNTGSIDHMQRLSGGAFLMGAEDADGFPGDAEGPIREIHLDPFYIDVYAVTNKDFGEFIKATHYKTEAEKFGWSYVFHLQLPEKLRKQLLNERASGLEWWCKVDGASWKNPEGPGSNSKKRRNHPVVHVTWNDAIVYAEWAGKRLPTEAEYEYAARGGLVQNKYAWGNELTPGGKHMCNIWQGKFPLENTEEDGFLATAPVDSFSKNGFGLYCITGNTWEWCFDSWGTGHDVFTNPVGAEENQRKVMRGGSFLCHDSYCNRYRVAARTSNTADSSAGNMGFRCVRDS